MNLYVSHSQDYLQAKMIACRGLSGPQEVKEAVDKVKARIRLRVTRGRPIGKPHQPQTPHRL
jgi:hypothetical protein